MRVCEERNAISLHALVTSLENVVAKKIKLSFYAQYSSSHSVEAGSVVF